MRQALWTVGTVALLTLGAGCAATGPVEYPQFVPPGTTVSGLDNPLYIHHGANFQSYPKLFEAILVTLQDQGFEILDANAYDGRIETLPRVAPGLLLPLKPGSPDLADRLLYTLQSYRDRASVVIMPEGKDGFFVKVTVFKELEDLPRPVRSTAGGANFRTDNDIARQFEVVDPTVFETNWIPKGRNIPVEQQILNRLKCRM